jgi:hypothetical protein
MTLCMQIVQHTGRMLPACVHRTVFQMYVLSPVPSCCSAGWSQHDMQPIPPLQRLAIVLKPWCVIARRQ